MASPTPTLFKPLKIGNFTVSHRVGLAPMSRFRGDAKGVPTDLMVEYYSQRSSTPGTLVITEGTIIHPRTDGMPLLPGIWNKEQIAGWKKVVDAVHKNKSFIFCQIAALGRLAHTDYLKTLGEAAGVPEGFPYVSASDVKLSDQDGIPRPLTVPEIHENVEWFVQAAKNAIKAGFDGIELHACNGCLVDQFIQDVSNHRTDDYGGSIEKRAKFSLEIISGIAKAISPERTAIRISPYSKVKDMGELNPVPTYTYLIRTLKDQIPNLAYLSVVESEGDKEKENVDWLRDIWKKDGGVFMSCMKHTRESGIKFAERGDVVLYGELFISNPDLPLRLLHNLPLTPANQATYFKAGTPEGYTDYPFATQN